MFSFFYKTFYFETFIYSIDAPQQSVTDKLEVLFTKKSGIFKSPNLKGKFLEYPAIFVLTQKWSLSSIRGTEDEPASLGGIITALNATQTKIEISVRPNSLYRILFFISLPFAFFIIIKSLVTMEFEFSLFGFWPFVFALPVLFISAKNASYKLRTKFENYLNIKQIEMMK